MGSGDKNRPKRHVCARHVVWAIGMSFFTSSHVFYILTNIYRLYLHLEGTKRVRVDHCGRQ